MLKITQAEAFFTVRAGTTLNRPEGLPEYIIAMYLNKLDLYIAGNYTAVQPGDIAIVSPGTPHRYLCTENLVHHWLHISGDLEPVLEHYRVSPNNVYRLENWEDIDQQFQQCAGAMHDHSRYRDEYLRLKAEQLILAMGQQLELRAETTSLDPRIVMRLKNLRTAMSVHPEQNWTVARMAEQAYLSESYFYQVYRMIFHCSPNRDLIDMRINRARQYLRDGCSVSATAELCGYQSISHFIRQFRQTLGYTPGRYRKA